MPTSVLEALQILVALIDLHDQKSKHLELLDRCANAKTARDLRKRFVGTFRWPAYGLCFNAKARDTVEQWRAYQHQMVRRHLTDRSRRRLVPQAILIVAALGLPFPFLNCRHPIRDVCTNLRRIV